MLRLFLAVLLHIAILVPATIQAVHAQTIYPLDRAEILAGARFDLKVEVPGHAAADTVTVTINGKPAADVVSAQPIFQQNEDDAGHSAIWIRDAVLGTPGKYIVTATHGEAKAEVQWEVFATPPPAARNVILFIGDGLSNGHRVAARMLSKGLREGRYGGELAMDDMPHMALVSTAGSDSIITDSANSASAFTTGHKTCNAAIGVYCSRGKTDASHPRMEAIAALARRLRGKAVGIVTDTEIQDATPASMVAQTRRRSNYDRITEMLFDARPEVILGGGSAGFLPAPQGRRRDNVDYLRKFEAAGYRLVASATDLEAAIQGEPPKHLLGLFHTRNLDGALDRRFLKKGTVEQFPDQPDLVDQLKAALAVLSKSEHGFVLMVEAGMIDKYSHALDWERAVYDTIKLDNAVQFAKSWAKPRSDTLIIVVADHTHPASIIGTYDDSRPGSALRDKLGIYSVAGFPDYPAADADGYPPSVDVQRRLAFAFSAYPDHCDSGRPSLANPNRAGDERACEIPGAARRIGNLPTQATGGIHSGEDVVLTATGPGAEFFRGRIDNTRVFRGMATALGLGRTE